MATWGSKDPDAIRDYGIDWSADIGDATIETSTWLLDGEAWAIDADLENLGDTSTDTTTTVRLGGGVVGITYNVTNHIVLSNGEEDDWTVKIKIKER